jgi:hypothetical protein
MSNIDCQGNKYLSFHDNDNFGFSEILEHDLREVHMKKKARRRNRSYQTSNNATLDEYFSIFCNESGESISL